MINHFYAHPAFIHSTAEMIQQHLVEQPDMLLFSYHGLPERHLHKSECQHRCRQTTCPLHAQVDFCYRQQCYKTSELIAQHLQLESHQYHVAFQSRLGKTPWIQPYTDHTLEKLAQQGVKRLAIVCPSFVADCLETLEEIGIRAQAQWKGLTGASLQLIPCLNGSSPWVARLAEMIKETT